MPFDFLLCTEFQTRAYNYNYALQLSVTSDIKLKLAEFKTEMGIKKPFGSFYISQQCILTTPSPLLLQISLMRFSLMHNFKKF